MIYFVVGFPTDRDPSNSADRLDSGRFVNLDTGPMIESKRFMIEKPRQTVRLIEESRLPGNAEIGANRSVALIFGHRTVVRVHVTI